MTQSLPLFGLHEHAVFPGEEVALGAPALDAASLRALPACVGQTVVVVTITTPVELPSLVAGRWAAQCTVLAATPESVTLRADARVQLHKVTGTAAPFQAELAIPSAFAPQPDEHALLQDLAQNGRQLLDALAQRALPGRAGWAQDLRAALAALLRAVATPDVLVELQQQPLHDALAKMAALLAKDAPDRTAVVTLETLTQQAGERPRPALLQRQLWSQVVELQRALDVYDPGAGSDESDLGRLQKRLMQAGLPKEARETARRELRLLRSMKSDHHDYSTYLGHLDLMARLPWHPDTVPDIDLDAVAAALDREHTGLAKPKQRVLEYLAVRKLGGTAAGAVLCLSGPPGVGKTTIARAMADAMGRKFARVALGGVHDESELRGHRLTYVAASPGRILQAVANAGTSTAVVLLDEIDKLGADRSRPPGAALLEILDPEQNPHFRDNFLGVPYDLSHLLFICTANDLSRIDPILRDRLEVLELDGYTLPEKERIATTHLLPRVTKETGIGTVPEVENAALRLLIEGHTREAGVRQLQRGLGQVLRARALKQAKGEPIQGPVTAQEVETVLGTRRNIATTAETTLPPGVATGLSVSADGGNLMFIEVVTAPGKGALRMTGQLGSVLRESARAALSYLRAQPERHGLTAQHLARDIHVHLPDGATPKDGPSAGCALVVALVSALTQKPARADIALTGEVTLQGKVLPVGGVRAKVLAAERAGLQRVLVPAANRADVPEDAQIAVQFVERVEEALAVMLGEEGR